jgi:hypothetical protein
VPQSRMGLDNANNGARIAGQRTTTAQLTSGFQCAGCGEWNEIVVEPAPTLKAIGIRCSPLTQLCLQG